MPEHEIAQRDDAHAPTLESFEQYAHHGVPVWVRSMLKGQYWPHCLCRSCVHFKKDDEKNCPVAKELDHLCQKNSLAAPVYECPQFEWNDMPEWGDKPNPGSQEALDEGCTCPVLDNHHGTGCGYKSADGKTAFIMTMGCPVHNPLPDAEEEE